MELPLWGGFYAGSDGYYLVEGQTNNKENDSAEVIRVIRYDTNWNRTVQQQLPVTRSFLAVRSARPLTMAVWK